MARKIFVSYKHRDSGVQSLSQYALTTALDYVYFVEQNASYNCSTTTWKTNTLFNIHGKNMFNRKQPKQGRCSNGLCGRVFHTGDDHSYIYPVRWDHFKSNINLYIGLATRI